MSIEFISPNTEQFHFVMTRTFMVSVDLDEYEREHGYEFDPTIVEALLEEDAFVDVDHEAFNQDGIWSCDVGSPFMTRWDTRQDLDMVKMRDHQIAALMKQIDLLERKLIDIRRRVDEPK